MWLYDVLCVGSVAIISGGTGIETRVDVVCVWMCVCVCLYVCLQIEGAGHWVHSEKMDEFVDPVCKLL